MLEKLPIRRVIRRKIRSCDCAITYIHTHIYPYISGDPSIWSNMKLHGIPLWLDKCFIVERVGEEFIEGVLSVDMSFERALYTDAQMDWPMTLTRTTHRIGTSSITHKSIICRENAVLSSAFVTCVLIDSKTGKSAPFPPVLYDRFKPQTNGQRLDSIPAYPLPPSGQYYKTIAKVSHSDIDFNQHLNASVYVRYCMDCAIDASNAGFLKYAFQNQETYLRKVANVKLLYLAESVPGG